MWPLVAALLLGSCCCGSAQLLFSNVKSVEFTKCNETVVIPCIVLNVEAQSTEEMYVKWKLNKTYIFIYDGSKNNSTVETNFTSAKISVSDLLKGDASLKMERQQAVLGNYTCEVTELSREGKTVIELKYRMDSIPDQGSDCSYHTTPTPAGDEKEKGGCKLGNHAVSRVASLAPLASTMGKWGPNLMELNSVLVVEPMERGSFHE